MTGRELAAKLLALPNPDLPVKYCDSTYGEEDIAAAEEQESQHYADGSWRPYSEAEKEDYRQEYGGEPRKDAECLKDDAKKPRIICLG